MPQFPAHIKNVIFDLGEVFTDVHFHKTTTAFNQLAEGGSIDLFSYEKQSSLFDWIETGKITPENFVKALQDRLKPNTSEREIGAAWTALLGETHLDKLELANALRPKFKTFILSNTNSMHIEAIYKELKINHKVHGLEPFFDKVYFSHDIGYRKPDAAAYLVVLNQNNLKASETIFIDDKLENTQAAAALGMEVIQLVDKEELYNILK